MPDFNLTKWPKAGEQPDGMYKPTVDHLEFLWSPTVELLVFFTPSQIGGINGWFYKGLGTASMLDGKLRYTSQVHASGSKCIYDMWYITSPIPPTIRARHTLYYWPPTVVWPSAVVFGLNEGFGLAGGLTGRERSTLGPGTPISASPECWETDLPIDIGTRAVDPLDNDVEEEDRFFALCNAP